MGWATSGCMCRCSSTYCDYEFRERCHAGQLHACSSNNNTWCTAARHMVHVTACATEGSDVLCRGLLRCDSTLGYSMLSWLEQLSVVLCG